MSSRTNVLSHTLRNAEGLKDILLKQKSLPVGDFAAAPPSTPSLLLPLAADSVLSNFKSPSPVMLPSMPLLLLPSADSILSDFESSLPAEVLDCCASTLRGSAEAVQRSYERAYRALYSSMQPTQDQVHKLRHICEQIYHRTSVTSVQHLMTLARQRVAKVHLETEDYAELKPRTRFRQEYVTFLEQCFRSNAYPSYSERACLAQETKMSDRQIEVWFQNHRNRARREGKVLRRPDTNSCVISPLAENHVSDSSGYESESSSPCSDQEISSKLDMSPQSYAPLKTIFEMEIPAHAFPTRYSEGRGMNKAECLKISADLWMRKSASAAPAVQEPIQIDQLIVLFSRKLTTQDATPLRRVKGRTRDQSAGRSRRSASPWYTATTTFAPKAPYFALVKIDSLPTHAPTLYSSHPIMKNTGPNLSRQRAPSSSSSSADESSCNELVTPPSSPPVSVFLQKTHPDWTTILDSVVA